MGQHLPLFADAVRFADIGPSDLEHIAWSHSRRQLLDQCPRRYFFEHFGASRQLRDLPGWEVLHFLKTLENRYERAGAILHQVIATWFRKAQRGEHWTADRLAQWAQSIYRRDLTFSAANPDGHSVDPKDNWPPILLREYHYRDPNAGALCSEVEERLVLALRSFALSDAFASIRQRGAVADALIETRVRVHGLACRVEGQVDLAFVEDAGITIVDWKLGASDGAGDDSLQLAVYGLWADQRWTDGKPVTVQKAYLGDETLVRWELTDQRRSAARARIAQDAERMAALQAYGEDGVVEAFSPCEQPAVCRQCCFLEACTEGRACLGDRNESTDRSTRR